MSKKKPPIIRPRGPILSEYFSDEDREHPSTNQELANLVSNGGGWRKVSRENTVHDVSINDTITNVTRYTPSSSALANDLRNKRIRADLPHTFAPIHDDFVNSSNRSSTLDTMRYNLGNNARNEVADEIGTRSLQGSGRLPSNNSVRDNNQSEDDLSHMETSAGNGVRINDTITNVTRYTASSSALANDMRNKRIREDLPHTLAPIHVECFDSSNRSSTLDTMRYNLRNNARNEVPDEIGTRSLQGSGRLPSNNSVRDNNQSEDDLSHMERRAGNPNTIQRGSARGRGAYKGIDLDKLTNGRKNKLLISFPPGKYFRPVGDHVEKLSSWLGYCARICGPPNVSWDQIEKKNRHRLWAMVQDYFDVSIHSPAKWKKLEESGNAEPDTLDMKRAKFEHFCFAQMKTSFGKWKHKLYGDYKLYSNDDERLKHLPEGLSPDDWKEMFKVFESEEFQKRSRINSDNRSFQKIVTSTGPKSFVQKEYEMMDEELGELPKASDLWKATHGISDDDGQIAFHDSESRRVYEDIERIENEPVHDDEPVPTSDYVLQQALGVKLGRIRGKGFGYKAITKGMASSSENNVVIELKNQLAKVTTELHEHKEYIKELEKREQERIERDQARIERDRLQEECDQERNRIFESYCKKMEGFFVNSSSSTQPPSEEQVD